MTDEPQTFPSVADCELRYAAALRRRDETKAELLAKHGTLSILALPRDEHQRLADACWDVERALTAIGRAQGRAKLQAMKPINVRVLP